VDEGSGRGVEVARGECTGSEVEGGEWTSNRGGRGEQLVGSGWEGIEGQGDEARRGERPSRDGAERTADGSSCVRCEFPTRRQKVSQSILDLPFRN
jgi:hypothetical protein